MIVSTNRGFVFTRIVFLWQWRSSLLFLGAGAAVAPRRETDAQGLRAPSNTVRKRPIAGLVAGTCCAVSGHVEN